VYADAASIEKLTKAANMKKPKPMYANTIENPVITGYPLFCAEYNQSFPDIKKLQGWQKQCIFLRQDHISYK